MTDAKTLVVIPAWNESSSIAQVIGEIRHSNNDVDLLVVDDGSSDSTGAKARAEGVDVVTNPFNLGVGGAMRVGFRFALSHGYDAVVQVDADGQHDPESITLLVSQLDDQVVPQMVIGSRFSGEQSYDASRTRRLAMRILAASLSRMSGEHLSDVTSGFRAHNRKAIAIFATEYPTDYLADTVESIAILTRAGGKISECPVAMRQRTTGKPSQSRWKSLIYLVRIFLVLGLTVFRKRTVRTAENESTSGSS